MFSINFFVLKSKNFELQSITYRLNTNYSL